ncbi:MAG: serine protease [Proteobacteria bacterium]|nr:serine protease [Pseudomonadota bacterium]MBU1711138.1 serine protease [Pseudomonadota bacterium]
MKKRDGRRIENFLFLFVFFFTVTGYFLVSAQDVSNQKVYVIPVSGDVEPGMNAFIKRAIEDHPHGQKAVYVFEMNTFGGRVDSALQIVDTLITVPRGRTIAYVTDKAISAGALIALACNDLVMKPHTTIGDCAPISFSNEGPKMMGEKFQSPLRAKFRTLARRNGYPPTLAESMVTDEMEVYLVVFKDRTVYLDKQEFDDLTQEERDGIVSKKTIVSKGELLTMDDAEALEYGFSRMTASSIEEMLGQFGINDYDLVRIEQSWSETFGRFVAAFAPILLMIGMAALYTELKAPGFGVPGLIGIICLGLVFFNQYLVGLADYTELLLIVLGLVLMAMELFVLPGFGIAGTLGFLFIGAGMVLSFQDFVLPDPNLPWQGDILLNNILQVMGSFVLAFIFGLMAIRYMLPRLGRVVDGPYLDETLAESKSSLDAFKNIRSGDRGTVITTLRPAGKVRIGTEVYDAITEGGFIDKGSEIQVIKLSGNRIVVGL